MHLDDATHAYTCQRCGTTGGVCMEALWLAQSVAAGVAARTQQLPGDFELLSTTRFTGCDRSCTVRLRVTADTVAVTAGSQGARIDATLHPIPLAATAG